MLRFLSFIYQLGLTVAIVTNDMTWYEAKVVTSNLPSPILSFVTDSDMKCAGAANQVLNVDLFCYMHPICNIHKANVPAFTDESANGVTRNCYTSVAPLTTTTVAPSTTTTTPLVKSNECAAGSFTSNAFGSATEVCGAYTSTNFAMAESTCSSLGHRLYFAKSGSELSSTKTILTTSLPLKRFWVSMKRMNWLTSNLAATMADFAPPADPTVYNDDSKNCVYIQILAPPSPPYLSHENCSALNYALCEKV